MAQAIGQAVIGQGYRVIYREAHVLLEEIAEAALDGKRKEYMELLATVPLLIIDDLGMRKLGPTAAEELLEIVMRRYELASTLVTSNRPVEDWGGRFPPCSIASCTTYPQMRAAELEDQVASGTMSPKISRKGPEKMQPRSSKRDFFELRGGNGPPPRNLGD